MRSLMMRNAFIFLQESHSNTHLMQLFYKFAKLINQIINLTVQYQYEFQF